MKSFDPCWSEIGVWGDVTCPELSKVLHCRNCKVYTNAALECLDRETAGDSGKDWADHYAGAKEDDGGDAARLMVFRLGSEWLGLPGGVFQEVASLRPIHSLPHRRDPVVLGIVNIRGELLVAVSLASALNIAKAPDAPKHYHGAERLMVIARGKRRFVFPVDEVFGLIRHGVKAVQKSPGTLLHSGQNVTRGILPWENHTVACLEEEALFNLLQRRLL